MFARLGAKAILLAVAVALVFFGVGLIGLGIAAALDAVCSARPAAMPSPARSSCCRP